MGGGNIQIVSIGPQDFHLTANPQITFFKKVYRRHTNFSFETRRIYFSGETPTFGSVDCLAKIKKEGDLLGKMYIDCNFTATCSKKGAYTVNHFGNSLVKKVELNIGGYIIDTLHSQWLQIYEELTNSNYRDENSQPISDSNGGLFTSLNFTHDIQQKKIKMEDRVTGNCPLVFGGNVHNGNLGNDTGTYSKRFYVPLCFWFNKNPGMYLPLLSLYNHDVKLKFNFEESYNLIGDSTHLTSPSINIKLYGEFFHLDVDEKRRFSQSNHEYLIEQVQLSTNAAIKTTSSINPDLTTELSEVNYDIDFSHPIKYLAWAIANEGQASSSISNNSGQGPCYFVSLCSNSIYGNDGNDGEVELLFDGVEREVSMPMIYYTRVLPKKYCHQMPPLDRIGFYSFALNPFDVEPSGTANFSKIYNKNIKIKFANNNTSNIINKNLYIYAVNYNIMIITNGMAVVKYT